MGQRGGAVTLPNDGDLAALSELCDLTGLDAQVWNDFLALPPAGQRIALDLYRGASWTRDPSTLERVVALVEVLVTVAGDVSGVAGAVAAVKGLAS